MKKSQKLRRKEVENLLRKQKIRSVEQIEAYKLSVCHPASAGIDLSVHLSWRLYAVSQTNCMILLSFLRSAGFSKTK